MRSAAVSGTAEPTNGVDSVAVTTGVVVAVVAARVAIGVLVYCV
jgi:hypothetical protein